MHTSGKITRLLSDPKQFYIDIVLEWNRLDGNLVEMPFEIIGAISKLLLHDQISTQVKNSLATFPSFKEVQNCCPKFDPHKLAAHYSFLLKFLGKELFKEWAHIYSISNKIESMQPLKFKAMFFLVASEERDYIQECCRNLFCSNNCIEICSYAKAYMLNRFPECDDYQKNIIDQILNRCRDNLLAIFNIIDIIGSTPSALATTYLNGMLSSNLLPRIIFLAFKSFAEENPTQFHTATGYKLLGQAIIYLDQCKEHLVAQELLNYFTIKSKIPKSYAMLIDDTLREILSSNPTISVTQMASAYLRRHEGENCKLIPILRQHTPSPTPEDPFEQNDVKKLKLSKINLVAG